MNPILVLCAQVCRWCWWSINALMNNDASGRMVIFCNNTTAQKGEPYGDLAFIQTLFCILMMKHFNETSSCLILLLQMQGDENVILKKYLTIALWYLCSNCCQITSVLPFLNKIFFLRLLKFWFFFFWHGFKSSNLTMLVIWCANTCFCWSSLRKVLVGWVGIWVGLKMMHLRHLRSNLEKFSYLHYSGF